VISDKSPGSDEYLVKYLPDDYRPVASISTTVDAKLAEAVKDARLTFVMIKPDGMKDLDAILSKLNGNNERDIVYQSQPIRLIRETAEQFYKEYEKRDFYAPLIKYMMSGEVIPILIRSKKEDAISDIRGIVGPITGVDKATGGKVQGTIRGDMMTDSDRNSQPITNRIHASDSIANVIREASIVLGKDRLEEVIAGLQRKALTGETQVAPKPTISEPIAEVKAPAQTFIVKAIFNSLTGKMFSIDPFAAILAVGGAASGLEWLREFVFEHEGITVLLVVTAVIVITLLTILLSNRQDKLDEKLFETDSIIQKIRSKISRPLRIDEALKLRKDAKRMIAQYRDFDVFYAPAVTHYEKNPAASDEYYYDYDGPPRVGLVTDKQEVIEIIAPKPIKNPAEPVMSKVRDEVGIKSLQTDEEINKLPVLCAGALNSPPISKTVKDVFSEEDLVRIHKLIKANDIHAEKVVLEPVRWELDPDSDRWFEGKVSVKLVLQGQGEEEKRSMKIGETSFAIFGGFGGDGLWPQRTNYDDVVCCLYHVNMFDRRPVKPTAIWDVSQTDTSIPKTTQEGKSDKSTTLNSVNPFAIGLGVVGIASILSTLKDFAFAHPIIAGIAAIGVVGLLGVLYLVFYMISSDGSNEPPQYVPLSEEERLIASNGGAWNIRDDERDDELERLRNIKKSLGEIDDRDTTLQSINPFAIGLGVVGLASILSAAKDLAFAHPIIAGVVALGIGVAAFFAIWRIFFPINWYIWRMKSNSYSVQTSIRHALIKIGTPAVPSLIKALASEDPIVRTNAAWALGAIKDPRAVEYLIELSKDNSDSFQVASAAKEALRTIRSDAAQQVKASKNTTAKFITMMVNKDLQGLDFKDVEKAIASGKTAIAEVSVDWAKKIKETYPNDVYTIFVSPLSEEQIRERMQNKGQTREEVIFEEMKERQKERAVEKPTSEEKQLARAQAAVIEMTRQNEYDTVIVNSELKDLEKDNARWAGDEGAKVVAQFMSAIDNARKSGKKLILYSGPSATGKGPLWNQVKQKHENEFSRIVLYTTRAPRPGEVEGVDYYFRTVEQLLQPALMGSGEGMGQKANLIGPNCKIFPENADISASTLEQGAQALRVPEGSKITGFTIRGGASYKSDFADLRGGVMKFDSDRSNIPVAIEGIEIPSANTLMDRKSLDRAIAKNGADKTIPFKQINAKGEELVLVHSSYCHPDQLLLPQGSFTNTSFKAEFSGFKGHRAFENGVLYIEEDESAKEKAEGRVYMVVPPDTCKSVVIKLKEGGFIIRQKDLAPINLGQGGDERQAAPATKQLFDLVEKSVKYDGAKATAAQADAHSIIGSVIVLARKAKLEGQNLVIGLETEWIPGINEGTGYGSQHDAMNLLLKEIKSIGDTLRGLGLDNVEVVEGSSQTLSETLLGKAKSNLSNVVVLASAGTINSASFEALRSTPQEKRAFLAGVDPSDMMEHYKEHKKDMELMGQLLEIKIMEMLSITLQLAVGKTPPNTPLIFSYDEVRRIVIFMPKPEAVDYRVLEDANKGRVAALRAA